MLVFSQVERNMIAVTYLPPKKSKTIFRFFFKKGFIWSLWDIAKLSRYYFVEIFVLIYLKLNRSEKLIQKPWARWYLQEPPGLELRIPTRAKQVTNWNKLATEERSFHDRCAPRIIKLETTKKIRLIGKLFMHMF